MPREPTLALPTIRPKVVVDNQSGAFVKNSGSAANKTKNRGETTEMFVWRKWTRTHERIGYMYILTFFKTRLPVICIGLWFAISAIIQIDSLLRPAVSLSFIFSWNISFSSSSLNFVNHEANASNGSWWFPKGPNRPLWLTSLPQQVFILSSSPRLLADDLDN